MLNMMMIQDLVRNALLEDMGTGDITTLSTIAEDVQITGRFIAKEDGIICGLPVAEAVFKEISADVVIQSDVADGSMVKKGDVFARVTGPARAILSGERVALNFMQRMSGIATYTHQLVEQVQGTQAKIVDTRKTTPGLRVIEKYAVRMGGGHNHRYNLSDGVLIKDNHIVAAGGIAQAVANARNIIPHTLKIEVEVKDFDEVQQALDAGADIIMLDNMTTEQMKQAVEMIDGRAIVEASGNMDRKPLPEIAATGVNIISVGALTHTVKAMDISLRF